MPERTLGLFVAWWLVLGCGEVVVCSKHVVVCVSKLVVCSKGLVREQRAPIILCRKRKFERRVLVHSWLVAVLGD